MAKLRFSYFHHFYVHVHIQVWHIQDQSCLTTITEKAHKVAGSLQSNLLCTVVTSYECIDYVILLAMHYNPGCRTLAIVTDVVAVLTLKGK